jgi:hypothetical protein
MQERSGAAFWILDFGFWIWEGVAGLGGAASAEEARRFQIADFGLVQP